MIGRDEVGRVDTDAVAVVFTGQGSQRAGMADGWAAHPHSASVLAEASDVLGQDVLALSQDAAALARTEVAQRVLFVCGVAAWRMLQATGLRPKVVAGHSLGEFTALVAAEVYDFAELLEVVAVRSSAMADAANERPGTMTAVIGPDAEALAAQAIAAEAGPELSVANHNSKSQVVLSGTVPAIERAEALVADGGGRSSRLRVAGAFHSPLMDAAADRVERALDRLSPRAPNTLVIPNVTASPTRNPEELDRAIRRHLLAPVRWSETVSEIANLRIGLFVECGPRPVLTGLSRSSLGGADCHAVVGPDSLPATANETVPWTGSPSQGLADPSDKADHRSPLEATP